jgi:chorismate synthase
MSGNTFGKLFKITTFGESHNKSIGVIIDGFPSDVDIDYDFIKNEIDRRRPGNNPYATTRSEPDKFEIQSGIFENRTTGTPICIIVKNKSYSSEAYENIKDNFRPGHADYTYFKKYGHRDYRGGGRSSGRETLARVIAGAFAKLFLIRYKDITINTYTIKVGNIRAKKRDFDFAESNFIRFTDEDKYPDVLTFLNDVKATGDSAGGVVELIARNVPAGLGEPVFDKIDADISKAIMSIGSVKGIEIGEGFASSELLGSQNNDRMNKDGFITNRCGGILGGITTGENIIVRLAIKPTPSISIPQDTIDKRGNETIIQINGQNDVIIVPRILPVVESMVAITLLDHILIQNSKLF